MPHSPRGMQDALAYLYAKVAVKLEIPDAGFQLRERGIRKHRHAGVPHTAHPMRRCARRGQGRTEPHIGVDHNPASDWPVPRVKELRFLQTAN